jgi:uncharacterized membrane protein YbhN (UPF0104 family)
LIFAAVLVLTLVLVSLDRLPSRLLPATVGRGAVRLASDSRAVFREFRYPCAIFISAFANQALLALAVFILARDLDVRITATDCIVLLPTVQLITALPISMGGWGVREFAMVTLLGYAGVPAASALVVSLVLALLSIIAAIPGGVLWLVKRRRYSSGREVSRLKDVF